MSAVVSLYDPIHKLVCYCSARQHGQNTEQGFYVIAKQQAFSSFTHRHKAKPCTSIVFPRLSFVAAHYTSTSEVHLLPLI
jgi:hypothetical protein